MFCTKCGTKNDEKSSFCVKCGETFRTDALKKKTHKLAIVLVCAAGFFIAVVGTLVFVIWHVASKDLKYVKSASEIEACKAELRGIQSGLELYYTHYKSYPDNISVLVTEGYLSEGADNDPWGNTFLYETTDKALNYRVGSVGADGKKGTADDIEPPINSKRHSFEKEK